MENKKDPFKYIKSILKKELFQLSEDKLIYSDFKVMVLQRFMYPYRFSVETDSNYYRCLEFAYYHLKESYQIYLKNFKK